MQPKVVLGIVTRDRAELLPQAIDSALAQSYSNYGVCVLNDGSTDATADLAVNYSQIGFINWSFSHGYVAARNYLMRNLAADYFVSLDDDAKFLKGDEITTAIAFLEKHPDAAVVAFDILSPDRRALQRRAEPRSVPTFIGCGHVARLNTIKKVGGYVPAPGGYGGEEKDLALRLIDAGYKIMLLPGVHVWHQKTTVARDSFEQHRSGVCNDFAMTLRRAPLTALPAALVAKFLRHHRFAKSHGLLSPFWAGAKLFVQSVPELWQSREPVRLSALQQYLKISRDSATQ